MEIIAKRKSVSVNGDGGETIHVCESNRGEPYRRGIEISIERGHDHLAGAFLEISEATSIRDLLNRVIPVQKRAPMGEETVVDRALDRLKLVRTPADMAMWINGFATPLCQRIVDLENPDGNKFIDPLAYTVEPQ